MEHVWFCLTCQQKPLRFIDVNGKVGVFIIVSFVLLHWLCHSHIPQLNLHMGKENAQSWSNNRNHLNYFSEESQYFTLNLGKYKLIINICLLIAVNYNIFVKRSSQFQLVNTLQIPSVQHFAAVSICDISLISGPKHSQQSTNLAIMNWKNLIFHSITWPGLACQQQSGSSHPAGRVQTWWLTLDGSGLSSSFDPCGRAAAGQCWRSPLICNH